MPGRRHEIREALNRTLTWFGIPRGLVVVAAGLGLCVFILGGVCVVSFGAAIVFFSLLCVLEYWMSASDFALVAVFATAAREASVYDPLTFEDYGLRWKGSRQQK